MAIKKSVKVLEPKIVNKMKEEMSTKKIPMEVLFMSRTYQKYLEKIASYITGRNIQVILTKEIETACTDNKKVYINPLMKIDEKDNTFESRNKIVLALLAHELFHILFTDFSTLNEITLYSGRRNLLKVINNILEDSHIEYLGTQIYAGDFRSAILFIRWMIMEMYDELQTIESPTNQLVSALSHYGSCGMLKGTLSEEVEPIWDEIQVIFEEGRRELDAKKRFRCSVKITKLIEPIADKESADNPESPDPFFGDNARSAKGSSSKDKMSREEIEKALSELDIHDLIEKAKKLLDNPEGFESEDEDDSSEESTPGLKIGVKGPKKDGEVPKTSEEGEAPDVIIDLSGEENSDSDDGSKAKDGPIVIKPEDEKSSEGEKKEKESKKSDAEKKVSLDEEEDSDKSEEGNDGKGSKSNGDGSESGAETKSDEDTSGAGKGGDENTESKGSVLKHSTEGSEDEETITEDPKFSKKEKELKELKELKESMEKDSERAAELVTELEKELRSEMLDEAVESEKAKEYRKISDKVDYGACHSRVKNLIESAKYTGPFMQEEYNKIVNKHKDVITQTVRKMKVILKQAVEEHYVKQRLGNFDVKNADQMYKSGKVFHRTKDATGKDIVFTVLVDESGSMSSGNNYENAKQAAIVFKEVCDDLDIPVLIMGFTAIGDGDKAYHRIYSNFGSPKETKYSITDIRARANNRDGYSIRFAGEVMNKFYPKANKVLMVISDGEPADVRYTDVRAKRDTKYHVDYVEKKLNTPVIALNICDRRRIHEGMFKHIVEVPVFSQLPEKLINVLKKEFKKMI